MVVTLAFATEPNDMMVIRNDASMVCNFDLIVWLFIIIPSLD